MNRRYNQYAVPFRIFAHDDTDSLEDVLRTIGRALLRAETRIKHIAKTQDGECLAEVAAEETVLVEDFLGCAFVAAQAHITRICARVKWLHERIARHGLLLKATGKGKHEVMSAFREKVLDTEHSKIEVIYAFANYFKHHEEWPSKWAKAKNRLQLETIAIIRSVGASDGLSDNCRKCVAALGIGVGSELSKMAEIVREWHAELANAYKTELTKFGQPHVPTRRRE